eukprot:gene26381-17474_t
MATLECNNIPTHSLPHLPCMQHVLDQLGRLNISDDGLMRRELMVLDTCLAEGIPVAGYVGGGYDADLNVLADRHICLHRAATQMWSDYELGLPRDP